ncbi:MAG: hypothetical protein C0582_01385 [Alphaproteobacteria bacterium]|nr:MAG: hypothetical protein C0582_01385 [Alphaproteobacteria bacterium]
MISIEGVVKMPLRRCLQEMRGLPKRQEDRRDVNSALAKAYYNPDAQESLAYSDIITILLGYVWPYMKTLSRDTQRAWLKLAVDEARMAYDGTYGLSLSCSKGIQERLVVTGFESFLADVDPRLIGLSTFAKMSATDFEGLFQPALRSLPKASYEKILRIHQSDATKRWFQNLFQEALLSLAHDVTEFGVDALQLAEDFACAEKFQSEVRKYAELYANPEYQKLDELKTLATRKISEINEREQEDPTMTASHLLSATGEGVAIHKRSLFLRYREHKITKPLIVEKSYQQAIESREAGDFQSAFEKFLFHAVYLDNPKAMYNIGFILYKKGDLISAHEWMSAAAGHGLDSSKQSLKKLVIELECTEANEEMAARLFLQKDQSTLIFIRGGWAPIAEGNIFESYESMNDHEILQTIAFSKNPGVALRYTALHEEDQVELY